MKCPNCGAQVTGKFCEYCGAEMPRTAPETVNNIEDHSSKQVINNFYFQGGPEKKSGASEYSYGDTRPLSGESYSAPIVSQKDWLETLLLCIFLGLFGAHHFYAGRIGRGVLYLCTLGIFGFGWFIDIILILTDRFQDSYGRRIVRDPNPVRRDMRMQRRDASPEWESGAFTSGSRGVTGRKKKMFIFMVVFMVLTVLSLLVGAGATIFVVLAVVFGVLYARTPDDE